MNKKILLGALLSVFVFNISAKKTPEELAKIRAELEEKRKQNPPKRITRMTEEEIKARDEEEAPKRKKWAEERQAQYEAAQRQNAAHAASYQKQLQEEAKAEAEKKAAEERAKAAAKEAEHLRAERDNYDSTYGKGSYDAMMRSRGIILKYE